MVARFGARARNCSKNRSLSPDNKESIDQASLYSRQRCAALACIISILAVAADAAVYGLEEDLR